VILGYYKLREQPFGVTPDPRYLYMGATHREAMASVQYGYKANRGFTALVAPPGMGKTTLLFNLLQELKNSAKTVFLFQPQYDPHGLLRSILADLEIDAGDGSIVEMHNRLNGFLVGESEAGRRVVVVIDEAQNLKAPVLEALRMLSNFETPREKLLHIVLAGQPQLAERLSSANMTQLRQRISIVARLSPFNGSETEAYIAHRLRVAGYEDEKPLFTAAASAMIAKHAGGIPRNINNLCFHALSIGCVKKDTQIGVDVIEEAVNDVDFASLIGEPAVAAVAPAKQMVQPAIALTMPIAEVAKSKRWPVMTGLAAAILLLLLWPALRATGRIAHSKDNAVASPAAISPKPAESLQVEASEATPSEPAGAASVPAASSGAASEVIPSSETKEVRAAAIKNEEAGKDTTTLEVKPHETVSGLSMANLGKYDKRVAEEIRRLNPWLTDPNAIRAGQTIRIPTETKAIGNNGGPSPEVSKASKVKVEKP
jgi:general secretion pathway protein A